MPRDHAKSTDIRERMDATGEPYSVARRNVAELHRLETIWERHNVWHGTLPDAYIAAVAAAVKGIGIDVIDFGTCWHPRDGFVTVIDAAGTEIILGWHEYQGWRYGDEGEHGTELNVGLIDDCDTVAKVFAVDVFGRDVSVHTWTPPHNYPEWPQAPADSAAAPDPDVELALTAYLDHPAWRNATSGKTASQS